LKENFSIIRTVKQWKSLPGKAVQSLSFEVSKTRLEEAQSNPVRPPSSLGFEQEVGLETSGSPFQS